MGREGKGVEVPTFISQVESLELALVFFFFFAHYYRCRIIYAPNIINICIYLFERLDAVKGYKI